MAGNLDALQADIDAAGGKAKNELLSLSFRHTFSPGEGAEDRQGRQAQRGRSGRLRSILLQGVLIHMCRSQHCLQRKRLSLTLVESFLNLSSR